MTETISQAPVSTAVSNPVPAIEWSPDQQEAVDKIRKWRADPKGECLTVGGYAGTGKTTLVTAMAREWPKTAVCALAGKAAYVLREKGIHATTIHRLIYDVDTTSGSPRFFRTKFLDAKTIIVDEASMIDEVLLNDLCSFGIPIMFVGDHGQLEPVGDNPNLMMDPMIRLERVHRQAWNNPILRLATAFREGRPTPYWQDKEGRLKVVPKVEFKKYMRPDRQMICGFNATRHKTNAEMRAMLGYKGLLERGERVICLRNNRIYGVFNGQLFTVKSVAPLSKKILFVDLQPDVGDVIQASCLTAQFGYDGLFYDRDEKDALALDYGYCISGHKSQGSEWDSVLVLDEVGRSWDPRRWRYTVATRAKEKLVYCM